MKRFALLICLIAPAAPVCADSVLAAVNIRSKTILTAEHIALSDMTIPGAAQDPAALIGMEAQVNLYANRPIRPEDVGPPTLIERNEIVPLIFHAGGLAISTDGRALGSAGAGDTLRVMNLTSRVTLFGTVRSDGAVIISPNSF